MSTAAPSAAPANFGPGAKRLGPHSSGPQRIGPYLLGKTLGAGSSGRVKLGTHIDTGLRVAIKIISKDSLAGNAKTPSEQSSNSSLNKKLEREITIMKLIRHPNVMQLYDVYENEKELFLILEHVEGGELFDYLVKRGRLPESEAARFFQQMIYGIDFCHRHLIAHRDLKPENLLLDRELNIKIADFGMASLQPTGKLLETSCGSPHYACPEIIRGLRYDGAPADIWSCGIILYALLTGNLPFDDENIRKLLQKVKTGIYHMPGWLSVEARDLIGRMLVVDPAQRITMDGIFAHSFLARAPTSGIGRLPGALDNPASLQPITDPSSLDPEIVDSLVLLGYGATPQDVIPALLNPERNIQRVFYWLLHQRKTEALEHYQAEESIPSLEDGHSTPRRRTNSFVSIYSTSSRHNLFQNNGSMTNVGGGPSADSLERQNSQVSATRSRDELPTLYPNLGLGGGSQGHLPSQHVAAGAGGSAASAVLAARPRQPGSSTGGAVMGTSMRKMSVVPKVASPLALGSLSAVDATSDSAAAAPEMDESPPRASPATRQQPPSLRLAIPSADVPAGALEGGAALRPPQIEKLQIQSGDGNMGAAMGSPRFHRRNRDMAAALPSPAVASTPKRSWFANLFSFKPEVYSLVFMLDEDMAKPSDVVEWFAEHLKQTGVQFQPRGASSLRCMYEVPPAGIPASLLKPIVSAQSELSASVTATSELSSGPHGRASAPLSPTTPDGSSAGQRQSMETAVSVASSSSDNQSSAQRTLRFAIDFAEECLQGGASGTRQVRVSMTLQQGPFSVFQAFGEHFRRLWQLEYDA